MESKDKIVERIKKLLILADQGKNSNLEEATSAASKAQALMEKYRIERAMLDIEDIISFEQLNDEGLPNTWKVYLAYVIAKYNGCYLIKSESYVSDNKLIIVGDTQDVATVQSLFKYLTAELTHLCLNAILSYQIITKQLPKKEYADSFYTGAINAIDHRLSETNKNVRNREINNADSAEKITQVCSAIDRLDNRIHRAKDWIENKASKVGIKDVHFKSEQINNENQEGFEAGVKAACNLDLNSHKKLEQNKNNPD